MTWLAIDRRPGETELSTLLALQPDTARALRDLALAASAALDPTTLALCARRAAHLHGVGTDVLAELVPLDAPAELVAELDRWTSSDRFDERTRWALRFAEQYAIDHTAIDQAEIDRLLERFEPSEVFRLATAFGVVDRILRVCRLLDVRGEEVAAIHPRIPFPDAPDSPAITRAAYDAFAPDLGAALVAYKTPLSRMRSVGYLTKELVRLRNAHVNGCTICGRFRNPRAIEDGFAEELADAVDDPGHAGLTDEQRVAVLLADAYLAGATLDDAGRAEVAATFTPTQVVEILLSLVSWGANRSTVLLGIDYVGDERLTLDTARAGTDFV